MKREIKFKVWDNKYKCITDYNQSKIGALLFDGRVIISTGFDEYDCPTWDFTKLEEERYSIMQFIGLKDKAGNDIYEGDIVRWDDGNNGTKWRVAEVLINPDIQFKIVRINCDFVQSAQEGYVFRFGNFIYRDTEKHFEILGNIYQNPELLITETIK